jgi:hypothetical protein
MNLPQARNTELVVQELKNELLIYNQTTHQAYTLNETAKIVYQSCDGSTSFDDLKRRHKFTDDLIYLTLDELKKKNLLEADNTSPFAGMNRREVIRKIGLTSMVALPVISSLVAPDAANAASGACPSVCVPAGQNICAGCSAPVVLRLYDPNTGCTGTLRGTSNYNCVFGATTAASNDVQRD